MNWTGGRLQRHSHNKPGSLARIQKQHFAKARLKAQRESQQESATQFSPLPASNALSATGKGCQLLSQEPCLGEPGTGGTLEVTDSQEDVGTIYLSQSHSKSLERPDQLKTSETLESKNENATLRPPTGSSRLDTLRQKLLQKDDWATVSVTRPLRISFAPPEEREKVGRRRKITDDDRKRQTIPVQTVISPEFYTRKRRKLEQGGRKIRTPGDIHITINGHQPVTPLATAGKIQQRQESSESMLLDKEERHTPSSIVKTRERSRRQAKRYGSQEFHSQLLNSTDDELARANLTTSINRNRQHRFASDDIHLQYTPSLELLDSNGCESDRYSSIASASTGNISMQDSPCVSGMTGRPVCNRFTIDEQVLAEKEGRLDSSLLQRNDDRHSRFSLMPLSQTSDDKRTRYSVTDQLSLSSNQRSDRLPAVKHKILRPMGPAQKTRTRLFEDMMRRASSEVAGHSEPPMKFFGQSLEEYTTEDNPLHLKLGVNTKVYDALLSDQNSHQNLCGHRLNYSPRSSHKTFSTSPLNIPVSDALLSKNGPHESIWIKTKNTLSSEYSPHQREEIRYGSMNEKTISPTLLHPSSCLSTPLRSTDRLSIPQIQSNAPPVLGWRTSSPRSLSATAFPQRQSDDRFARFENIHADDVNRLPFFKKPFRR